MISVGSVSSPMSIADLRKKGGASTAQAADPATTGDYTTAKNSQRPLSEYVRFETKDYKWDSKRQCHVNPSTGEVLSPEESEDFRRYLQRYKERKQTGEQADKLVKLVGKCNPAVEEELRIYIGRFPGEIRTLLDTRTAELRHDKKDKAKKAKDKKKQKAKKEGKKEKKQKKTAKKDKQDMVDAGDPNKTNKTEDVQCHTAANPSPEEIDWGSDDDEAQLDTTPSAATSLGGCDSDNKVVSDP
ncbi:hypothetical protein AK812_SmicGene36692 [Symbiodinium microadriaticum]|uniref:Uncharacterized protein n=1 Tax=Symbiodinium microadriaticum TaxID=2951 RepID=A0A1Q9CI84_SYMMI|nr:hypothetical protein AK812_SmicGene36692 [Symbiodinium microadriaticum]